MLYQDDYIVKHWQLFYVIIHVYAQMNDDMKGIYVSMNMFQ